MNDRPDYSETGDRLRRIRERFSDLTQRGWADACGFNVTQYNNWERGVRRIPLDAAEVLVRRYGLTLDFIYLGRRDGLPDTLSKTL